MRDIYFAVTLFLQVRATHPNLIQKYREPWFLLLTSHLDTQATLLSSLADTATFATLELKNFSNMDCRPTLHPM